MGHGPNSTAAAGIPVVLALVFVALGSTWIVLDEALRPTRVSALYQVSKSLFFLLATSLLLFMLVRRRLASVRRHEAEIVRSESRLRALVENSLDVLLLVGADGSLRYASRAAESLLGEGIQDLQSLISLEIVHPDDLQQVEEAIARIRHRPTEDAEFEVRLRRPSGRWAVMEVRARSLLADPDVEGYLVVARDVTERHDAEEAVRVSERRLRALFEHAEETVSILDSRSRLVFRIGSPRSPFARLVSEVPEEPFSLVHPADRPFVTDAFARLLERPGGNTPVLEARVKARDGTWRWCEGIGTNLLEEPAVQGVVLNWRDVTERRRAENARRESDQRYRQIVETTREGVFTIDEGDTLSYVNERMADLSGRPAEELPGLPFVTLFPAERRDEALHLIQRSREGVDQRMELEVESGDGTRVWVSIASNPLYDQAGDYRGSLGVVTDITERKRYEAGMAARDAILQAVADLAEGLLQTGAWERQIDAVLARLGEVTEADRVYVFENHPGADGTARATQVHEWCAEGILSQIENPEMVDMPWVEVGLGSWYATLSQGRVVRGWTDDFPAPIRSVLESQSVVSILISPIQVDGEMWGTLGFDDCREGREWSNAEADALRTAAGMIGAAISRQRADDALQESQARLILSQRMEAIGRLAGGVAHDFNNMLTAITGFSELLETGDLDPRQREYLGEIRSASARAATITQQLLAVGRQQRLEPVVLDPAVVIAEMKAMLEQLIGEGLVLTSRAESDLGRVRVDRGQLEQVVMNLVLNARDAMPDGGEVVIEGREVEIEDAGEESLSPGRYVRLAVIDHGIGMSEEIRGRIFEPFFSTKPQGKGTGLGLATVYGIVHQSGGFIRVTSVPGEGTEVAVHLPVVASDPTLPQASDPVRAPAKSGPEGARILLVEDEDVVRVLVRRVLEGKGYLVLEAKNGLEGLEIADRERSRLDLLLTDVRMPGMGGVQLVEKLGRPRPPVLYMSGYSEDLVSPEALEERDVGFISKPFAPVDLLERVREALAV
ncbi:MAG TPA: PAS domain S-box protein [Longimicrobiaceae bacterium]|nr:PAS domain S-box protein [Longimicrobiaceae bacterium]